MFRFGDILRWKDREEVWPEPWGRFMYVSADPLGTVYGQVICVRAVPNSGWVEDPGPIAINETDMELADD